MQVDNVQPIVSMNTNITNTSRRPQHISLRYKSPIHHVACKLHGATHASSVCHTTGQTHARATRRDHARFIPRSTQKCKAWSIAVDPIVVDPAWATRSAHVCVGLTHCIASGRAAVVAQPSTALAMAGCTGTAVVESSASISMSPPCVAGVRETQVERMATHATSRTSTHSLRIAGARPKPHNQRSVRRGPSASTTSTRACAAMRRGRCHAAGSGQGRRGSLTRAGGAARSSR